MRAFHSLLTLMRRRQGFTPLALPGLALWLDAQHAGSFTITGGGVAQWRDRSGLGNHAAQGTAGNRPARLISGIGGRAAVEFSANTHELVVTHAPTLNYSSMELFVVCQRDADMNNAQVPIEKFRTGGQSQWQVQIASNDAYSAQVSDTGSSGSGVSIANATANTVGVPALVHLSLNQATGAQLSVNAGTPSYGNLSTFYNGTGNLFLGKQATTATALMGRIGEVVLFTRALTADERVRMYRYLSDRWQLGLTLPPVRDVYVLLGQSNAEGYAANTAAPGWVKGSIADALIWNPTATAWQTLNNDGNNLAVAAARFGPEMALMYHLTRARPGVPQYLMKYAVSNRHLANELLSNSFYPLGGAEYAAAITRLDDAMRALAAAGTLAQIRGYLWSQGGNDALSESRATAYAANLNLLIDSLRANEAVKGYGAGATSGGRFVIAGLQNYVSPHTHTDTVRQAQFTVGTTRPDTGYVDTLPYTLIADGIHYDHDGQIDLGEAFARWFVAVDAPYSGNLALHVDATDLLGVVADGAAVSSWPDRSGTGNHLAQATPSLRPTFRAAYVHGRPAVEFWPEGGTNSVLRATDNATLDYTRCTCFVVMQRVSTTAGLQSVAGKYNTATNQREFLLNIGSGTQVAEAVVSPDGTFTNASTVIVAGAVPLGAPQLLEFVHNGTAFTLLRNGVASATVSKTVFNGTADFALGATANTSQQYRGVVAEALFYTAKLTPLQRQHARTHLMAKWGIAG